MTASSADQATARAGFAWLLPRQRPARSGLPPVWSGRRRHHLALLILAGFGQAAAAGVSAQFFSHALRPSGASLRGVLFGFCVAAAVMVGLLRMAERVLAERLSQDYVHEVRLGLIRHNLQRGRVTSLGVAVARTTSDLTSVKNWIHQGVAPLAVGIPLIIGVGIALILLDPLFAIGLLVPVALLVLAMRVLAPVAYLRTRIVRRQRGRLSSQVADTLLSTAAIRSAGSEEREMARIEKHSQALASASIERAKVAGAMHGTAAAMSGIATVVVIGAGLLAGLPTHTIAGALAIVGFLAAPIHGLGRVVEYRQTYRAARRVIGPAIEQEADPALERVCVSAVPSADVGGSVVAAYLELSDGTMMPELAARPGDRVVVDAGSDRLTSEVLERFVRLRDRCAGEIVVGGKNLAVAGPQDFRQLVGYAAQGMSLDPGGEPSTVPERARLLLARAILDNPPLLVFDHLDADLGEAGRPEMRRLLASYPGVVILASHDPDQIIAPTHIWRTDGLDRIEPRQITG